jgi:hypothetical protein
MSVSVVRVPLPAREGAPERVRDRARAQALHVCGRAAEVDARGAVSDPVTFNDLPGGAPAVRSGEACYERSTIARIMARGNNLDPLTRRPFTNADRALLGVPPIPVQNGGGGGEQPLTFPTASLPLTYAAIEITAVAVDTLARVGQTSGRWLSFTQRAVDAMAAALDALAAFTPAAARGPQAAPYQQAAFQVRGGGLPLPPPAPNGGSAPKPPPFKILSCAHASMGVWGRSPHWGPEGAKPPQVVRTAVRAMHAMRAQEPAWDAEFAESAWRELAAEFAEESPEKRRAYTQMRQIALDEAVRLGGGGYGIVAV